MFFFFFLLQLITLKGAKTKLNTYVNPADIVSRLELIITKSTEVIISAEKFESDYKDGEVTLVAMADLENLNAVVGELSFFIFLIQ